MECKKENIGDNVDFIKGYAFKSSDFKNNGIPVVKVGNLNNDFDKKGEWNYLDPNECGRYEKVRLKENDVVISTVGSWPTNPKSVVGKVTIIPKHCEGFYLNQNAVILRTKNDKQLTQKFLGCVLKESKFKDYIEGCAQGSASQASITLEDIKQYSFYKRNFEEQKKIEEFIFSISKKIELNNLINDNLLEITNKLYKRWFIDFEFDSNNGDLYKSSGGKMVDSEVGKIPEHWMVIRLGDYLDIERGLSYKGKFLSDTGIPMINLGNIMPNGVFRLEKNKYYTGEFKDKVTTESGSIVVANTDMTQNREVIGTPVIIPSIYKNEKIIYSHHIYGIKNLKLPKMFVFYTLLTERYRAVVAGSATGTTVLALPKEVIENYKIAIPKDNLIEKFENIAIKIQNKKDSIIEENIILEQLRDLLLPKLMDGEIDLKKIKI